MSNKEFKDKDLNELIGKAIEGEEQELKQYVFKSVHEKNVVIHFVSARSEAEAIEKVKYNLCKDYEVVCMTNIMAEMSIISLEEMESAKKAGDKCEGEGNPPEELLDNTGEVQNYILRTIEDSTSYYTCNAFDEEDAWDTVYRNFDEGVCFRQAILEGPEVITEDEMNAEFEHEGKFSMKLLEESNNGNSGE